MEFLLQKDTFVEIVELKPADETFEYGYAKLRIIEKPKEWI